MPNIKRGKPKRAIDKKQGLRHILHAAIRMSFADEDPFAINVLAQSADKVTIDLIKRAKIKDPFSFEDRLRSEHKAEFFAIYREPYNFLKHADKDHDGKLEVHNIVRANDLLIFGAMNRHIKLFDVMTEHMKHFQTFIIASYPNIFRLEELEGGAQLANAWKNIAHVTRGEFLETLRTQLRQNGKYLDERSEDLIDVWEENRQSLSGERRPAFKLQ